MAHIRWIEDHGLYQRVHVQLDNAYVQSVVMPDGTDVHESRYVSVFAGHIMGLPYTPCETAPYLCDEHGNILDDAEPVTILHGDNVSEAIHMMGEQLV